MKSWKFVALAVTVWALGGCSETNAGTDGGADAAGRFDSSTQDGQAIEQDGQSVEGDTGEAVENDAGATVENDAGATGSDASASTDAGRYGRCGMATHTCLCGCAGMTGTAARECQQGCVSSETMDCQLCQADGAARCCPTEARAVNDCSIAAQRPSDAGPACTTQECLQSRCSAQIAALSSCAESAAGSSATCRSYIQPCFGTYPITCP